MCTLFFAVWLVSSQVANAEDGGQAQEQAYRLKMWPVYVAGCSRPTVPPMPPLEAAAVSEMCISIFYQVVFGNPAVPTAQLGD